MEDEGKSVDEGKRKKTRKRMNETDVQAGRQTGRQRVSGREVEWMWGGSGRR